MRRSNVLLTGVVCLVAAGLLGCPLVKDSAELSKNPDDDYGDKPVFYVDLENVSGIEDGLAWDTAFTQIHRAIAAAEKIYGGAEVWVAEGNYVQKDEEDEPFVLEMAPDVDMYGGFVGIGPNGYETERDQRDWEENETFVTAHVTLHPCRFRLVVIDGADAVLDGFTVAGFLSPFLGYGPGRCVVAVGTSIVIRNCAFAMTDTPELSSLNRITGIQARLADVSVENCTFRNMKYGVSISESTATISDCSFVDDLGFQWRMRSEAISCFRTDLTVERCTFRRESAAPSEGLTGGSFVRVSECSPTIRDCVFSGNGNRRGNSEGGGAIWCVYGAPTIENCRFEGNACEGPGGAVKCTNLSGVRDLTCFGVPPGGWHAFTDDLPTFIDCVFANNSSPVGGAVACVDISAEFKRCTFIGNSADHGGAMHQALGASSFVDCVFEGNMADVTGGAVDAAEMTSIREFFSRVRQDGLLFDGAAPVFTGCTFRDNVAPFGGAVCSMDGAELTFDACRFSGNVAPFGGGVCSMDGAELTFDACRFSGNVGDVGGAVMNTYAGASTSLVNCVLDHNTATDQGGAICIGVGPLDLMNCTVANNAAPEGPAILFAGRGLTLTNTVLWDGVHEGLNGFIKVPDGLIPGNAETVSTVTYSLVPGGCPGTGNVTGSPAFVAPATGDYRLMPGSACVDAGTATGAPDIDINNVPRPRGAGIDIGAYEKP